MMNFSKKIIVLILTFAISLAAMVPVSALEGKNKKNSAVQNQEQKFSMSERMNFQEITEAIAKESHITKSQAEQKVRSSYEKENRNSSLNLKAQVPGATYRILSIPLTVTAEYQPRLRLYCLTSEGDYHYGILEIIEGNICREYNPKANGKTVKITKEFSGSVYANLEDPNTIFYSVNGDFFDNGITHGDRAEIGVGQTSVNYNIPSQVWNHYAYCCLEKRGTF